MAKNLKLNIKNTQIAEALNLGSLKDKLKKKTAKSQAAPEEQKIEEAQQPLEEKAGHFEEGSESAQHPRIKARTKSAFAESAVSEEPKEEETIPPVISQESVSEESLEIPQEVPEVIIDEKPEAPSAPVEEKLETPISEPVRTPAPPPTTTSPVRAHTQPAAREVRDSRQTQGTSPLFKSTQEIEKKLTDRDRFRKPTGEKEAYPPRKTFAEKPPHTPPKTFSTPPKPRESHGKTMILEAEEKKRKQMTENLKRFQSIEPREKLGPTGRHVKDLLVSKRPAPVDRVDPRSRTRAPGAPAEDSRQAAKTADKKPKPKTAEEEAAKTNKPLKFREFKDVKPTKKVEAPKSFDARDRLGLRDQESEESWRRKRPSKKKHKIEQDVTIRPTSLKVRLPISIKDLAAEMKLKAAELISKLFLQGIVVTLNDVLNDETTVQLLGNELGCEIQIDVSEEERLQITGKSIKEEILESETSLVIRPPVVAFMGHVDHGKTSLIDAIRKSNRAQHEAGAITQHIGAFSCSTSVGKITILDTPGHEAFSSMRARGADVTDIVVLVVAGDEGIKPQTMEAIEHAKTAGVTLVVAINKSDKPAFNPENVYRQLAEQNLLPESWGGQVITVNCSAVTGEGIQDLLEMLAIQSEVLELRADPESRARGTVIESQLHKGMGAVATVLVQNGTLRLGDSLVFEESWGKVKTMRDEHGSLLTTAGPSAPVQITGLSELPEAGQEFIVVKSDKEAREIAQDRSIRRKRDVQQKKKITLDSLLKTSPDKKVLNLLLRADVQGSLEAVKQALEKIKSKKVEVNVISAEVGEISESDVQLAGVSKALILGFHTCVESHAEPLIKQLGVDIRLHDIIYHAVDDVKALMTGLLDKISIEEERGAAEVRAVFKSSQLGLIAGCYVTEGSVARNHQARVRRGKEIVWKGSISSLKRVKEDVREVLKGLECGILLQGYSEVQDGDIIETYETTYLAQEL